MEDKIKNLVGDLEDTLALGADGVDLSYLGEVFVASATLILHAVADAAEAAGEDPQEVAEMVAHYLSAPPYTWSEIVAMAPAVEEAAA